VPPEWATVIDRLELHGVELTRLGEPVKLRVDSYRFTKADWQKEPYEGRHPLNCEIEPITEERTYPAGSVVVDMDQPLARVIAHALEPKGPDSFVGWGFFDAIFEQKEYADRDVMEQLAKQMLEDDESLRADLDARMAEDPEFAKSPRRILNWFYARTPYWDSQKDVYPVGKIADRKVVESLRK